MTKCVSWIRIINMLAYRFVIIFLYSNAKASARFSCVCFIAAGTIYVHMTFDYCSVCDERNLLLLFVWFLNQPLEKKWNGLGHGLAFSTILLDESGSLASCSMTPQTRSKSREYEKLAFMAVHFLFCDLFVRIFNLSLFVWDQVRYI